MFKLKDALVRNNARLDALKKKKTCKSMAIKYELSSTERKRGIHVVTPHNKFLVGCAQAALQS